MTRNLFSSLIIVLFVSISSAQTPVSSDPILNSLQNRMPKYEPQKNVTLNGNQAIYGDKVFENDVSFNGTETHSGNTSFTNLTVTHSTFTNITATNATMTNLTATTINTNKKHWELTFSTYIAGNFTDYTISGLLGTRGNREIKIDGIIKNGNAGTGSCTYRLRFGSSTAVDTNSNYAWQYAGGYATTPSCDTDDDDSGIVFSWCSSSAYYYTQFNGLIYIPSTAFVSYEGQTHDMDENGKAIYGTNTICGNWNNVGSQVNQIRISASVSNGIGPGTELNVWEMK
jgi:hypothetical protein